MLSIHEILMQVKIEFLRSDYNNLAMIKRIGENL